MLKTIMLYMGDWMELFEKRKEVGYCYYEAKVSNYGIYEFDIDDIKNSEIKLLDGLPEDTQIVILYN